MKLALRECFGASEPLLLLYNHNFMHASSSEVRHCDELMRMRRVGLGRTKTNQITFSNGCLGSHNDEERSEMRYVVRIASPASHQNFERNLHFPREVCLLECLCTLPTSSLPLSSEERAPVRPFLLSVSRQTGGKERRRCATEQKGQGVSVRFSPERSSLRPPSLFSSCRKTTS